MRRFGRCLRDPLQATIIILRYSYLVAAVGFKPSAFWHMFGAAVPIFCPLKHWRRGFEPHPRHGCSDLAAGLCPCTTSPNRLHICLAYSSNLNYYVAPKRQRTSSRIHGVTFKDMVILVVSAVKAAISAWVDFDLHGSCKLQVTAHLKSVCFMSRGTAVRERTSPYLLVAMDTPICIEPSLFISHSSSFSRFCIVFVFQAGLFFHEERFYSSVYFTIRDFLFLFYVFSSLHLSVYLTLGTFFLRYSFL
jgi:hypothetical protein